MSDADDTKVTAVVQETELPRQLSPTDTSNWDNKVSTDPDGEKYIRTTDEDSE